MNNKDLKILCRRALANINNFFSRSVNLSDESRYIESALCAVECFKL